MSSVTDEIVWLEWLIAQAEKNIAKWKAGIEFLKKNGDQRK